MDVLAPKASFILSEGFLNKHFTKYLAWNIACLFNLFLIIIVKQFRKCKRKIG